MTTQHNSPEFIISQVYTSQDGTEKYIHSEDVTAHLEQLCDKDEAFNEAVSLVSKTLGSDWSIEITDNGDSMTATWTK